MNLARRFSWVLVILTVSSLLAAGPAAVGAAPGAATPGPGSAAADQLISLELKGTDIRDALDALAKLSGTNIIADQSVQGEVTVTLNGVPFPRALDLLVKANGFSYQWVGNIVVVAKRGQLDDALEGQTVQTFPLKNAGPQEMAKALALVLPPQNIVPDERTRSLIVKGSPTMLAQAKQLLSALDRDSEAEEATRVFPLSRAVPEDLKAAIEAVVPNGAVTVGAGGKSLIVRAPRGQLPEIEKLVASVEEARAEGPAGSEAVQVRVYELRFAASDEIKPALAAVVPGASIQVGRKDRLLVVRGTDSDLRQVEELLAKLDVPTRQAVIEARVEEVLLSGYKELGLDWEFPLEFLRNDAGDPFRITRVGSEFTAALAALEEKGDATVLANPRITVVDGREASIYVGDRLPVMVEKQVAEGGVLRTIKEVQFVDVGVTLKVTPRFNADDTLTVVIGPEISSATEWSEEGYPTISTRRAQTTMILRNGETIALGGLISENDVDTFKKTPILGDIPLLGYLFQKKVTDKRKTDVVIFLTPRFAPAVAPAQ